ncbi:MAG: hypothetical protein N2111_05885 [Candidatus Sumerlaeaceae bacterium]|nr:hypothetical protein [Candidatus Sumerlaeaceae bacterium]
MPTYEYECEACGGRFEYFQWISEEPRVTCEACGGGLKRLLSAGTGLIFKGSGFYITDYKGGKPSKDGDSKGESKGESSSGSKAGEAKAAAESKSTESAAKKAGD